MFGFVFLCCILPFLFVYLSLYCIKPVSYLHLGPEKHQITRWFSLDESEVKKQKNLLNKIDQNLSEKIISGPKSSNPDVFLLVIGEIFQTLLMYQL